MALLLLILLGSIGCPQGRGGGDDDDQSDDDDGVSAPEGLDEAARFLVAEFYNRDSRFVVGLEEVEEWYLESGFQLHGQEVTTENLEVFGLDSLTAGSIDHLELDELPGGREAEEATGVVTVSNVECPFGLTEDLVTRADQEEVFSHWQDYSRTFETSLPRFTGATQQLSFDPVANDLPRFEEAADLSAFETSFLLTRATGDPRQNLFFDLLPHELVVDFRHGWFEFNGVELPYLAVLTFHPGEVSESTETAGVRQFFSVDLYFSQIDGPLLRIYLGWREEESPLGQAEAKRGHVAESLSQSDDLEQSCFGTR